MKLLKFPLLLSLSTLLTVSASAAEILLSTEWGETFDGAAIRYTPTGEQDNKQLVISIDHSMSGKQRIYFDLYYVKGINKDICSYGAKPPEITSNIVFNGQAIEMIRFCNQSLYNGYTYSSYTPASQEELDVLLNIFFNATKPVKLKLDNDTILLPIIGFTQTWNNAGGDANLGLSSS